MMRAGDWTVEVVNLDGRQWYQVKYNGVLTGGTTQRRGLVTTAADVQALLGSSFVEELEPSQCTPRQRPEHRGRNSRRRGCAREMSRAPTPRATRARVVAVGSWSLTAGNAAQQPRDTGRAARIRARRASGRCSGIATTTTRG